MGGPGFSSRRPNASHLPQFELPPPSLTSHQKYQYAVNGSQGSQTPGSLASVGNLLTPPSTIGQDISPSPGTSVATTSASSHSYNTNNGGYTSWSPQQQHQPQQHYYNQTQNSYPNQRVSYSPVNRGNPHSPPTSDSGNIPPYELPQFPSSSAPMGTSMTASMASQAAHNQQHQPQMHGAMLGTSSGTTSASQLSPANPQDAFRPPPTPSFFSQQSTPSQANFPYTTGPSPSHMGTSLSSTGTIASRPPPQMSPTSAGSMGSMPAAPPVQSPHAYQGRFPTAYGPVMSNVHNPNGQPILLGGLPAGISHLNGRSFCGDACGGGPPYMVDIVAM